MKRNLNTMASLVSERPPRSRRLKAREATTKKVKKEMAKKEDSVEPPAKAGGGTATGMPDRGGLISAHQGRGRGHSANGV
jgi:hypothetical protein